MAAPTSFDKKVYEAIDRTDHLPDQFKTWLPRYLSLLSAMKIQKQQLPGIMGEIFVNVGDVGAPAFTSPWRHYAAGASIYGKVRFYKDYLGIVHIEGLAETTGTPGSGLVFTLPAGYRPSQAQLVIVWGATAAGTTHVATRIDISTTGDVAITTQPAYTAFTASSWLSLANIHFRAG